MNNELSSGVAGLVEEGEAFRRLNASSTERQSDRRFYPGMALAFLVTALAGFAPSYYLKSVSQAQPMSLLVHIHALVFTAWLLLLLTQTALVAARRVDWHMRLGIAGAALAATMVPVGLMTAVAAARIQLLIFQTGAIVMFAGFVGAALWQRRRSELHRRLIMLATICLMPPAIVRLPVIGHRPALAVLLSMLFVIAGVVHDLRSRGRVHPVYVWGGLVILVSGPLRFLVGQTSTWQSFARFLIE